MLAEENQKDASGGEKMLLMNPHPEYLPHPPRPFRPGYDPIPLVMDDDDDDTYFFSVAYEPNPHIPRYLPFVPQSRPCDSRRLKRKSISDESIIAAVAAYKWESKQSSSGSKAAWNTFGEKETGGDGAFGVDELSGKTGHFARKCSLGGNFNGGCSGGHGGGNMGRHSAPECPSANS